MASSKDSDIKKIIGIVSNLFTSNFNEGAIKGVIKYVQKMNTEITNIEDGIAQVLQYDCHNLQLLVRIIDEYSNGFIESFPDEITEYHENSRNKMIVMIVAYLANYRSYFSISVENVIDDINLYLHQNLNMIRLRYDVCKKTWKEDAADLRKWYIKSYMEAGFILWQDPIIGCIDDYIAYLGN
jgi:hypothetical protein